MAANFRTADFEKIDEIHFRLGIIYKQLQRYSESLQVSQFNFSRDRAPGFFLVKSATDKACRSASIGYYAIHPIR